MNIEEAVLYSQNNDAQQKWAEKAWINLSEVVSSGMSEKIQTVIDFGCGTGEVTMQLPGWIATLNAKLTNQRLFPEQVLGMDISAAMIEYCIGHYLVEGKVLPCNETKIGFEVADAAKPSSMPQSWKYHFDLLTSFTALHWVLDHEAALNSMHYCLKDCGLAVISFIIEPDRAFLNANARIMEQWNVLPQNWGKSSFDSWEWSKNDPLEGYRKMASDCGFHVLLATTERCTHSLVDEADLNAWVKLFAPGLSYISNDKKDEFIRDMAKEHLDACISQNRPGDFEWGSIVNEMLFIVLQKVQ